MESETVGDFKAIRAKFQQEIAVNRIKNKPLVPEKPKVIPPPGASLSAFSVEPESNPSVVSKVILKDAKKGLPGKRPMAYPLPLPPCTPSLFSGKTIEKDDAVRQASRDKRLSLVLPVPAKEQKPRLSSAFSSISPPIQGHKRTWFPFKTSPERRQYALNPTSPSKTAGETVSVNVAADPREECSKFPCQTSVPSLPEDQDCAQLWSKAVSHFRSTLESAKKEHPSGPVLTDVSSEHRSDASAEQLPKANNTLLTSKLTQTSCEDLSDNAVKKVKKRADVSEPPIVSVVGASLNVVTHLLPLGKGPDDDEKRVDFETNTSQQDFQIETPPPVIPLPSLETLGPRPNKPPRPIFVDLSFFWTVLQDEQCKRGPIGERKTTVREGLASEVALSADTTFPRCPDAMVPETKGVCSPDLGVKAGEHELKEPKVSVLEALGLWPKGPSCVISEPSEPNLLPAEARQIVITDCLGETTSKDVKSSLAPLTGAVPDNADCVYEDVDTVGKFRWSQNTWRRKTVPKNPYAEVMSEDARKSSWFYNPCNSRKGSPEDEKDQKKKEKLRVERERKEQKEREKKENEMRKKFKVTGQEEPMYRAKVMVASKGRKRDLPVQAGDVVSIIRTTSCPKGKWLARDSSHRYGYIPVMNVELDIKEMLELGKKASQGVGRSGALDTDTFSEGSRSSNPCPAHSSSFSDSEEWTCDEDSVSPATELGSHNQTAQIAEITGTDGTDGKPEPAYSETDFDDTQARCEALQKLATFFHQQQDIGVLAQIEENSSPICEANQGLCSEEEQAFFSEQGPDLQLPDLMILPPPELFADRD